MNHCLLMQLYISQVQDVESSSSCTKIGWIFWKNKKSVVIQRWFPLKKKTPSQLREGEFHFNPEVWVHGKSSNQSVTFANKRQRRKFSVQAREQSHH